MKQTIDHPFALAARRAARRLTLADWLARLQRTAWPLALAVALGGALAVWLGLQPRLALLGLLAVPAWLAAAWLLAWRQRPTPLAALARWDEQAGRQEMFASAYWFESQSNPSVGALLHLEKARLALALDQGRLAHDLPLRASASVWLSPLALSGLLAALLLWQQPLAAEDRPLDEAAQRRAIEAAQQLAQQRQPWETTDALTPEEQQKAQELREQVEQTTQQLQQAGQQTPRDVLQQLEQLAQQAESLAQSMRDSDLEQLSGAMLAELERHADTADLAAALRARNLQQAATELDELAALLRDPSLPVETAARIEQAFAAALEVATENDRRSPLGQHLQPSLEGMQADDHPAAAEPLEQLAEMLRQAGQRQQTQQQLQQLAQALRAAGQQIAGSQSGQMQRLAQAPSPGLQPLPPLPGQAPRPGANSGPRAPRPPRPANPFVRPSRCSSGQCGQCSACAACPVPGSGQGGRGRGGQAPVPGAPRVAQAPVPGSQRGGTRAGNGAAGYEDETTDPLGTENTQVVEAQIGDQGSSELQEIDGQQHTEEAGLTPQQVALALQAEEQALADEPLPLARREQVLRYFQQLRERLEQQP